MSNHPHQGWLGRELPPQDWRESAQCLGDDPDRYDLTTIEKGGPDRDTIARHLCHGCPVLTDCALDAYVADDVQTVRAGVWLTATSKQNRTMLEPIARKHPQWLKYA